jgi:hypothetical protein
MKTVHVRSLSLPKGVPVPHYDTLVELREHVKGDDNKLVDVLNKYGRQKDSLVNARDWLSEVAAKGDAELKIPSLGFPVHDRETKKPLTNTDKDKPETESTHLDRFVTAVAAGKHQVSGLTVTGKDDEEKEKSVWAFLQTLIDKHGPFPFDLNEKARAGKPKNPPVWAKDAATSIVNGGAKRTGEWVDKFTNGYESKGYGHVDPIEFSPFDVAAAKGASPEEVEKVRQTNITNLAWAIVAVEEQKRAKQAKAEYV